MKKLKLILRAILRASLLLLPGIAAGFYSWPLAPALIAIMAAMGVELIFLIVWAISSVFIQAYKDEMKKRPQTDSIDTTSP